MEGFAKVLLILTVILGALSLDVKGLRILKENEDVVDQPQTFGSFAGGFPSPGFGGSLPSPVFGGSFPSPSISGSFPSPGFGGSFPSPGFSGSFPSPSLGSGPSSFCSLPGVRCATVQPNLPADGSTKTGSP